MTPNTAKRLTKIMLCTMANLLGIFGLAAQSVPRWDALNEPGNLGRVEAVAVSPYNSKIILAGGDVLGVGLSTNGGFSWEQTTGINACSEINDFTFDRRQSNVIWVGTLSGPYQSCDGGFTWSLKRNGMPPLSPTTITAPIQKVLFDPNRTSVLLAIGGNHRHMGYGTAGKTGWGAVWKSTDAGESWKKLTTIGGGPEEAGSEVTGEVINDAGFAAGSSLIVYACSGEGGVYKSIDGGAHFRPANDGLPNTEAWSLALHPSNPDVLWVSLGRGGTVYKSVDEAKTWRESSRGIATDATGRTEVRTVAVAPTDPNYLYCAAWTRPANAYRSTDGGATWTTLVRNGGKSTLVGGTGNPSGFFFQWMSVDPNNATHVLGACEGNVVQSFDGGNTWKDITCRRVEGGWRGNGYGGLCCTAIAWNPYRRGQVFTLGMDGGKLLRSDDSLWSWNLADPGLIGPFNGANDVTFAADGTIYVASGQFGNMAGAYRNEPILKSTNWGASWAYTRRPEGAMGDNKAVYVDPSNSGHLWAIMGDTLYASLDGGSKWTPLILAQSGHLWNLAADPRHVGTIYVGAQHGIFQTRDGRTFSMISGSPVSSNFEYVYVDPVTPGVLYVVSFNSGSRRGVYRYDGRWKCLFKKPEARALAVDPGNPQCLAVITKWWPARDVSEADGVWLSTNRGQTWAQCNQNLRMLRGSTIAFNPDKSGQLILGTDGAGFYATDLGTSSSRVQPVPCIPGTVQCEDYDLGGKDVAYGNTVAGHDTVGIGSGGSGRVVRRLVAGEWLKYTVEVTHAGYFDILFRIASTSGRGRFHLEANGVNVTGPITVNGPAERPWQDIVRRGIPLGPGMQHLKLCMEEAGADFDYLRFVASE